MKTRAEILHNSRVRPIAHSRERLQSVFAQNDPLDPFAPLPQKVKVDAYRVSLSGARNFLVIACADEDGWEHASVSPNGSKNELDQPCPTWSDMCEIKRLFWNDSEDVIELHPNKASRISGVCGIETNILHMWRPKDGDWSAMNTWREIHG